MSVVFREQLQAAQRSESAQWNTLILEHGYQRQAVFIMFEGRSDPAFYRHCAERCYRRGVSLRFLRGGNKAKVLARAAEYFSRFGNNPRVLFAVDKDHEDFAPSFRPHLGTWVYTTSAYSVENFLCCRQVVEAFLVDICAVDSFGVCEALGTKYETAREQFAIEMRPLMAWVIAARKKGYALQLGNLKTGSLFELGEGLELRAKLDPARAHQLLESNACARPGAERISDEDVRSEDELLALAPAARWLRGKQDLWLLLVFLQGAVKLLNREGFAVRPAIPLGEKNAVGTLGVKAPPPGCAIDFFVRSARESQLAPMVEGAN